MRMQGASKLEKVPPAEQEPAEQLSLEAAELELRRSLEAVEAKLTAQLDTVKSSLDELELDNETEAWRSEAEVVTRLAERDIAKAENLARQELAGQSVSKADWEPLYGRPVELQTAALDGALTEGLPEPPHPVGVSMAEAEEMAEDLAREVEVTRELALPKNIYQKVISLQAKREEWSAEADQLRRKGELGELSQKEAERLRALKAQLRKVELIVQRTEALKQRDVARAEALRLQAEISSKTQAAEELGAKQQLAASELKGNETALAEQRVRLEELEADYQLNYGNVSSDKLQQLHELPKTIASLEAAVQEQRINLSQFDTQIKAVDSEIVERHEARNRIESRASQANLEAAKLGLALAAMAVALEGEPKFEYKSQVVEAVSRPEQPVTSPAERPKPGAVRLARVVGRGVAAMGLASVYSVGQGFSGALRVVERLFDNLYKLIANPTKFFADLKSRYAHDMAEAPKGKGKLRGFLRATGWLLFGEPLKKRSSEETVDRSK